MLGSMREKRGVGISGDRWIRARDLARHATSAGRPPSYWGSSLLIFQNGTCLVYRQAETCMGLAGGDRVSQTHTRSCQTKSKQESSIPCSMSPTALHTRLRWRAAKSLTDLPALFGSEEALGLRSQPGGGAGSDHPQLRPYDRRDATQQKVGPLL